MRDLYNEIKEENFKNITYGLYNKIDDDSFVSYLRNKYKKCFSIDDFEYQEIILNDKEKLLGKMHIKKYDLNFVILKQKLSKKDTYCLYVDEEKGKVYVIRLKNSSI